MTIYFIRLCLFLFSPSNANSNSLQALMESRMVTKSLHQDVPAHILPRTSGAANISEIMSLDTSHPEMAGAQGLYPGSCQKTCVRVSQIFFDAKSWLLLSIEHNVIWHFDIFKAPQGYHLTDLNLMCTVYSNVRLVYSNPILLYWTLTNLLNHPTVTNSQHFNVIMRV